jgi:hypothetical protein
VFVAKLDATGRLVYSTYLGGSSDDIGFGIVVDASGAAYVTGYTFSDDFPTTPGAFGQMQGGLYDAFVAKLSADGSALLYSTYLGGGNPDHGADIAVDGQGSVYVTGITQSEDFPVTPGAIQPELGGGMCGSFPCADTFVTKLDATGSRLVYSTYLGGASEDGADTIALDASGAAYAAGYANSGDFPTTPDAYQPTQHPSGLIDAFVTKLNASGSALVYSTFLGGAMWDEVHDITVDQSGEVHITGETWSGDFPMTPEAAQAVCGGCPDASDAFITTLNATGSRLAYSTFLGGSARDPGYGIALDERGAAYVTGSTFSLDFPTTPGAFQTTFGGGYHDAFAAKLRLGATSHLVYLPISLSSYLRVRQRPCPLTPCKGMRGQTGLATVTRTPV